MALEVEQKYRLQDVAAVRTAIENLGGSFLSPIQQVDRYFRHPERDFARTDEALRLRKVGDEVCITYKGPKIDQETKTRREIELPLVPGPRSLTAWSELLEILGFQQSLEVSKQRTPGTLTWDGAEVHLALDNVPALGDFLELEMVTSEQGFPVAKQQLLSLAARLGLQNVERRGYLTLLLEKKDGASRAAN